MSNWTDATGTNWPAPDVARATSIPSTFRPLPARVAESLHRHLLDAAFDVRGLVSLHPMNIGAVALRDGQTMRTLPAWPPALRAELVAALAGAPDGRAVVVVDTRETLAWVAPSDDAAALLSRRSGDT